MTNKIPLFLILTFVFGMMFAGCDEDGSIINSTITFNSVTANGSLLETTTQLTLIFSQPILNFSVNNITLNGITGIKKDNLSNYGTSYTLEINGFTDGGILSVAVNKPGYIINNSIKTVNIFCGGLNGILIKRESIINRELIDVGFNQYELVFIHKIGEIRNAFVGFLTPMDMYYTGISEAQITYRKSTSVTAAEEQSTTIVEYNTITNGLSVSASVDTIISSLIFDLGYTLSLENTQGIETTYGKSIAAQILESSDYTYTLSPAMGAGRYTIVGTMDYTIYQLTRYNLNTNRIIGEPVIFFAASKENSRMVLHLVKGNDEILSLSYVTDKMIPVIPSVSNITQWEISRALVFAREKTQNVYEVIWGNNFSQNGEFGSSGWHTYDKLDTFLEPSGGIAGNIPIELLTAYGFTDFSVRLNYSWNSINRNNIEMMFKFVNKTTGEQFGETPNTTGSFIFGGANNKFDLSRLRRSETIVVDMRHKKKSGWDGILPLGYGISISNGRMYTITFE